MQVAFAWAESLGPARGARMLQQKGLLDRVVAYGVQAGHFKAAQALAQVAGAGHLAAWAYQQHALALQEQGACIFARPCQRTVELKDALTSCNRWIH